MSVGKTPPRSSAPGEAGKALMDRIDRALAHWPVREKGALEWDEMADAVASRAVSEARPEPDTDLLRPPLPPSSRERGLRIAAGWWTALGGIAAVAAVAAAVFLAFPHAAKTDPGGTVAVQPAVTSSPRGVLGAPSVAPVDDRGVDPADLPRVVSADTRGPSAPGRPSAPPRVAVVVEPSAVDAPKGKVGASDSSDSLQPAAAVAAGSGLAGGPDSVPLKPPVGAIQSALGVAGRAARACLVPGDAPVHAMVTFRSDGSVNDVAVSGDMAGAAAASCIRGALAKARVAPFAAPFYAAPVTVRPN
jgi:hypothetical protein